MCDLLRRMPERIYKLQPDRTVSLRGFDHFGAAAAVHSATPGGFKVSGVFRDAADFAVVVLYDADNFYEHPRLKHLPDFDFSGLTLQFDLRQQHLMPIDCRKYPTIDWPYLGIERPDGARERIRLSDWITGIAEGRNDRAEAEVEIVANEMQGYDRVTLWYLNLAFDYIVPGKLATEFAFSGSTGSLHSVLVGERAYVYQQQPGDTAATVVAHLAAQINSGPDPDASAEPGGEPHLLMLKARGDDGTSFPVSASGNTSETLWKVRAETVARNLAAQINATDCIALGAPFGLDAAAEGRKIRLTTRTGGYDANFIRMYATWKNSRLAASRDVIPFSGATSEATLRVRLDFTALGITEIRRMWLTLAPRLTGGGPFEPVEWLAEFQNWVLEGPEERRALRVAGPDSVRIASGSSECRYEGAWELEEGFYHDGHARVSRQIAGAVTVRYRCDLPHSLWLGTALTTDGAPVGVRIDGLSHPSLSTALPGAEPVVTRRRLAALLGPGEHEVRLHSLDAGRFTFNFLEAAVEGDVPDAPPAQTFFSPALDYSTDHTYKLPPARLHWIFDRMGLTGPMNEYLGVFWWNQRKPSGGSLPSATVRAAGDFVEGDKLFLRIGNQTFGKSVFAADTPETIARHFAFFLNATQTGVRAQADGDEVTIWPRSAAPAYRYPLSVQKESAPGSTGTLTLTGHLQGGEMPEWIVDETEDPPLNRAAFDWHADFYREAARRGRRVTSACSMELVLPPAHFAARHPDGAPVETSVGFGGLVSTHCAFQSAMLTYQKAVYLTLGQLMQQAGLPPDLQFGEFTWWYFSNWSAANPDGGMAYYDAETREAAQAALGRPLAVFRGANDNPTVNGGEDARFLASRLHGYVADLAAYLRGALPGVTLEVLFPYDVNYPVPAGIHQLGGALNRAINFPPEWGSKGTSSFDRLKVEALDFGAWSRNLDLVLASLKFPLQTGWPADSVRVMVPVFRGGSPWNREVEWARSLGMDFAHLWAFDHFCLHGYPQILPGTGWSGTQG